MTLKPLAHDFPLVSDMAVRPPRLVATDELLLELEEELDRRRTAYPRLVERGAITEEEARHHNAAWRAMIADHRGEPYALDWEARIRELRRELALRRNTWPKWAASATHPLTPDEAVRRIERLDALHWRYWMQLWRFSAADPVDDCRRHAFAARMEIVRRRAAWSADKASDDAAASDRAIANERTWRAIELYRLAAGDDIELAPPLGDTIRAMAATATARLDALLFAPTTADSDAMIAQLAPLTRWLERAAGSTFKATREERMAA